MFAFCVFMWISSIVVKQWMWNIRMALILSNLLRKRLNQPSSWLFTAMKESLNQSVPFWLNISISHTNGYDIKPIVHKESVDYSLPNILQVMGFSLNEMLLLLKTMFFLCVLKIRKICQTPSTLVFVLFIVIMAFDPGKK